MEGKEMDGTKQVLVANKRVDVPGIMKERERNGKERKGRDGTAPCQYSLPAKALLSQA